MDYSPKLKSIMADIQQILIKNDIAGVVILYDSFGEPQLVNDARFVQGFSELLFHINTSYTVARLEGDCLKVRGKAIHYPSKEVRDNQLAKTYTMITHIKDVISEMTIQAVNIHKVVRRLVDPEESDGRFTSHQSQNN